MTIDDFSQMATTLLAISLASERLVTLAKTIFPTALARETKNDVTGAVDLKGDQTRRLIVIGLSIVTSWITAAFLVDAGFDLMGSIAIGKSRMPVPLLGLLASGGSAFWGNILEYTKASKDIQTQRKATETLIHDNTVETVNRSNQGQNNHANNQQQPVQDLMHIANALTPPDLNIAKSRVKRTNA